MPQPTIQQLLIERASVMAAHDGGPLGAVYIHAAANALQAELLAARDAGLHAPIAIPEPKPDPELVARPRARVAAVETSE